MQETAAHSTVRVAKTVEEPEPEGASAHRGPASLCITPQWIAGTLSMALYWAWFFVTMFSDAILLPLPASLHIEPIFRSACFLGILASLVFLQFFARTILKRRHGSIKILIISLVASPWLYVVTALTTSADMLVIPLELLIWLLEGIALGSFLLLTSAVIVNSSVRSSMFMLGIAATIGAALYMMISYIQQPHAFAIVACIPFLCAFIFCTSGQTDYQESEADQQRAIKPMSSIIDSFAVQPAQPFYGLVYGLAVSVGVSIGCEAYELRGLRAEKPVHCGA